ncbi:type II toxin-antitoxin system ChpB family toxin [Pseudomonas aeruginosa]|uniref:type II toxin-antitoxin system ChpB family toxin n=1 Tax=Pseudomonas aeruginosa TaxID=287 RepID=UPI00053D2924|nr:type II toxin-antitoxin system ChpB family toxin [Pseudomonas aeruginosa]EKU4819923.1 type II toxin-antitoxin system ChpB family toxin [Pseudomonas aeruginosa]EKU6312359.1 type II toxin-antitoxin system ChpB family toxin [Pseudomonas aeruginosa]EKW1994416.1 type II toxin-antitoxin system ChpB family toxin [Pseudomonas aeruginosa]EKX2973810.1 type II toxin-antitoxin system ChpB family toxin [Pseudomonas aeruginosa]ELH7339650.1 type II toxin-antitoxin system ChpB family toxin [Pseudomonas aer
MKRAKYGRGDIVRLNLNPTAGREQQGDFRPALVLTPAAYNATGLAVIAPITQGGDFARYAGFAVTLSGAGTETQGVILCNQIRSVDLEARGAKRIEVAPDVVIEDALARVQALFE